MIEIAAIIARIKNDDVFRDDLTAYEMAYGPLPDNVNEMEIWAHLEKAIALHYQTPDDMLTEFDRDLLLRLVVTSQSTDYKLIFDDEVSELPELSIQAYSNGVSVSKKISELNDSQIAQLFYTYIKEQLSLQLILHDFAAYNDTSLHQDRAKKLEAWDKQSSLARAQIIKVRAKKRLKKLLED